MNRRWYEYARGLRKFTEAELAELLPATSSRCLMARIALLPRVLGDELDRLGAPLQIFQFVTYGRSGPGVPSELVRQTRFRAAVQFFERAGRWPYRYEIPDIRRRTEEELGLRAPESEKTEPTSAPAAPSGRDGESVDREEWETQAPALSTAAIEAALDGKDPMRLRTIERFVQLRRQTAGR